MCCLFIQKIGGDRGLLGVHIYGLNIYYRVELTAAKNPGNFFIQTNEPNLVIGTVRNMVCNLRAVVRTNQLPVTTMSI